MSSFQTFLLGFVILIIGLALAAHLLGAPPLWIAVGVIVLIGIGIISATNRTKPRDPHHPRDPNQPPYPPRDPQRPHY